MHISKAPTPLCTQVKLKLRKNNHQGKANLSATRAIQKTHKGYTFASVRNADSGHFQFLQKLFGPLVPMGRWSCFVNFRSECEKPIDLNHFVIGPHVFVQKGCKNMVRLMNAKILVTSFLVILRMCIFPKPQHHFAHRGSSS